RRRGRSRREGEGRNRSDRRAVSVRPHGENGPTAGADTQSSSTSLTEHPTDDRATAGGIPRLRDHRYAGQGQQTRALIDNRDGVDHAAGNRANGGREDVRLRALVQRRRKDDDGRLRIERTARSGDAARRRTLTEGGQGLRTAVLVRQPAIEHRTGEGHGRGNRAADDGIPGRCASGRGDREIRLPNRGDAVLDGDRT